MKNCKELKKCIACGGTDLTLTLDLGDQPLANNFLSKPDVAEEFYPLAVNRCQECNHLQLTHIVNPTIIYQNYSYVSGTSKTYLEYMDWFARWCREYTDCYYGAVLDIGCNDGSQLDAFNQIGFNTYGVDPAENLHEISKEKNHKVVCGFWNDDSIKKLKCNKFNIVVSQNAFVHVPDPVEYLKLLEPLMSKNGLFFIQTSQADMVVNGEFDTIYHEHISFYNAESMKKLAKMAGWNLIDAVKTPIHGTSYVFVLSPNKKRPKHIKNLIEIESTLAKAETYETWANTAKNISSEFKNKIDAMRKDNYKIVGYGAAAKGMTLLNFAQVDLDCIIDDNPLKQGKYSPGRNIPVVGIEHLEQYKNEKVLFVPLAWNFFNEIKSKILQHRNSDSATCFLRYFPEVKLENK
jgi:2-polyprenyl-3-methyl-5-hydroxy-6-metoxy-1,4-benzoquinol methylase